MIIERLRKKPEDFTWVPSLSHRPLKRDEIIAEIENDTEVGRHYVEMIIGATISRIEKANNPRKKVRK